MHTLTTDDPVVVVLVVVLMVLVVVLMVILEVRVAWHTLTTDDMTTLYPIMDDYNTSVEFSEFLSSYISAPD